MSKYNFICHLLMLHCTRAALYIFCILQNEDELEDSLRKRKQNEPYLCSIGSQYFVAIERKPYFSDDSALLSMINLFPHFIVSIYRTQHLSSLFIIFCNSTFLKSLHLCHHLPLSQECCPLLKTCNLQLYSVLILYSIFVKHIYFLY